MSSRTKEIGRNDPCHCGSGKKFKQCCESKRARMSPGQVLVVVLIAVVIAGGLALAIASRDHDGQPSGVWSEEHGHYH